MLESLNVLSSEFEVFVDLEPSKDKKSIILEWSDDLIEELCLRIL